MMLLLYLLAIVPSCFLVVTYLYLLRQLIIKHWKSILSFIMISTTIFVIVIIAIILDVPQQCLDALRNQVQFDLKPPFYWQLATLALFGMWMLEKRGKQVPVKVVKVQQVEKRSNLEAEVASLRHDMNRILNYLEQEVTVASVKNHDKQHKS